MEHCGVCKIEYPEGILTSTEDSSVCGICALKQSSQALGIERSKFLDKESEHRRQKAISWRNKNNLS